jgi:hypothetical protein
MLLLAACDCGPSNDPNKPDVHVVSFAPEGSTLDERAAMQLLFDQPVVSEDQIGAPFSDAIVTVEPAIDIDVHFRDRQTLVASPVEALTPGTRYTLTIDPDAFPADVPEDQLSHSFVFHPIEVRGVVGTDPSYFPPEAPFEIGFNLPVAAADVARHCAIFRGENRTALERAGENEAADTISMKPSSALAQGERYELRCEGITPHGGNAALAAEYKQDLHVYPLASIVRTTPAANGTVTPDELELLVETATPVDRESLARHVTLHPDIPGFSTGWVQQDERTFTQTLNLEAATDYELRFAQGLTDRFGQRLASATNVAFRTTDASPRLYLETGIFAVEAESPGFPVYTRNLSEFRVQCAFIPKNEIPRMLTTTMDYDPWYSDGSDAINWTEHRLRPVEFTVPIAQARNRWSLHDLDLPNRCGGAGRRGMYLAEFKSAEVEAARRGGDGWWQYPYRLLGNVTNLGVLLKAGPSSGLVWVTSVSTAAPVEGAQVTVYDSRGARVHAGRTDANGLLRMPGSSTLLRQRGPGDADPYQEEEYGYEMDGYRSQRMLVIVEKDGDLATVDGNWQNGIQIWNFGVDQDTRTGGASTVRGFILSDRGIYRPGERVHFKGFVRELTAGSAPRVPARRALSVTVEDSEGTQVFARRIEASPFGGFDFSLNLGEEAPLGDYYVRAQLGTTTFREEFVVQEFRPVSFEITERSSTAAAPRIGDRMRFDYNASYLFGAPVGSAEAEWTIYRRRKFVSFPEYSEYTFEDWSGSEDGYWARYETPEQQWITDGSGRTSARGDLSVQFQDRATSLAGAQDYLVDVRITDPTDQTVSKRSVITIHPTDMYLGLHTQEWVQAVNMPFAINAVALTPEGRRIAANATLSYEKRTHRCAGGEGPYGHWNCETESHPVWSRQISLREGGVTTERINPTEAGEFTIKLSGTDRAGRPVVATSTVYIIGEGEAFWSGDESARMGLIASKARYEPGETARLVPQADVGGATALITYERDGVFDARVERLAAGVPAIEVPVDGSFAPNMYVSVAAVRGRTSPRDEGRPIFRMGLANLEVATTQKRLAIEITTERDDYRPGETVNGSIRVLANGAPVSAEVSLSVADEGVLQLIAYKTPDPLAAFYERWGLGVENSTNWNRIARSRPPLGFEEGEDGDDGGGRSDQVRSRFVSSAFWAPALVTDAEGRATFSFEAPDNLTAFRLMAAAADAGDRFGSSEKRIRIRKELMISPILPRFFHQGDRIRVGATVHNHTGSDATATVRIEPQGVWIREREETVTVPAGGTARVVFRGQVSCSGRRATIRFSAEMGAHRDASEHTIDIRADRVIDREAVSEGYLEGPGNVEAALAWADPTIAGESRLLVTVDRTGLSDLEPSLRYLLEYPYGCLEQTLSSLIPLFKVRDLATTLNLVGLRNQAKLRTYISLGVSKVFRHQHADGHFSLWPSTDTEPFLTAYALWGLAEAKAAGVTVREDASQRGLTALQTWANDSRRSMGSPGETATMATAAYVLAVWNRPDAGLNARLYEGRAALPSYGKAFLMRALVRSRGPLEQIQTLGREIEAAAVIDGDRATIRETANESDLHHYLNTDVRSTAIALSAFLEAEPSHAMIPQLVNGLKHARVEGGRWSNTQENLYALVGLSDYARRVTEGTTNVTVTLGGRVLERRALTGATALAIDQRLNRIEPGALRIESDGPVYYGVRMLLARPPAAGDARMDGFDVARQYLDHGSGMPITEARVGQLIRVVVTVRAPETYEHVAVVDPIPSGAEVVNLELATESARGPTPAEPRPWEARTWAHRELRDDRAEAFATRFEAGDETFEYLIRATREGTFSVPGTTVETMYDPSHFARLASTTLTVR